MGTGKIFGTGKRRIWKRVGLFATKAAFRLVAYALHGKIANDFNNVSLTANSTAKEMKIDQIINGGGSAVIQIRVDKGDIKIAEVNP